MQYIEKLDAAIGTANAEPVPAFPEEGSRARQILHILDSIDAQHDLALLDIEQSCADEDLKLFIKEDMVARHQDRREPYAKLLEELRQQHRASVAA